MNLVFNTSSLRSSEAPRLRRGLALLMALLLIPIDFTAYAASSKDVYGNKNQEEKADDAAPPPTQSSAQTPAAAVPSSGERAPLIEVSVDALEISETDSKALGVFWGQAGATSNGITTLDQGHLNFLEASPTPSIFNVGTLNRSSIMAQLQALASNNQVRVLANPTLLTKSGFEATFLVGGEIPYPTPGQLGQIGVEFKKYGVALKILPQITNHNTIDAVINVGVSNPDSSVAIQISGVTVPGLSAREAGTKVEVKDGETVVLAGIKQSRRTKIVTRVPILGSIPLLGLLFRSTEDDLTQTSLVFFVTFRLVK